MAKAYTRRLKSGKVVRVKASQTATIGRRTTASSRARAAKKAGVTVSGAVGRSTAKSRKLLRSASRRTTASSRQRAVNKALKAQGKRK